MKDYYHLLNYGHSVPLSAVFLYVLDDMTGSHLFGNPYLPDGRPVAENQSSLATKFSKLAGKYMIPVKVTTDASQSAMANALISGLVEKGVISEADFIGRVNDFVRKNPKYSLGPRLTD